MINKIFLDRLYSKRQKFLSEIFTLQELANKDLPTFQCEHCKRTDKTIQEQLQESNDWYQMVDMLISDYIELHSK